MVICFLAHSTQSSFLLHQPTLIFFNGREDKLKAACLRWGKERLAGKKDEVESTKLMERNSFAAEGR